MKQDLPPFNFWQLLWRYVLALAFSVGFTIAECVSVLPKVWQWKSYFHNQAAVVQFESGHLFLILWLPAIIAFAFAAFPPHWSSSESSKRRVTFLVRLVIVTLILNIAARLFLESALESYFLPRGYVQCETELHGHNLMMKTYEFAQDPALCRDGKKH